MSTRRVRQRGNDSGAALLLAIGAVLMVSAISAGLTAAAASSMQNRNSLEALRNRQWAADSAIEVAITQVRALDCSSTTGFTPDTTNGVAIRVDWATDCSRSVPSSDSEATPYLQRDVVFSACLNTNPPSPCLDADVIIRAQVNFEPASGAVTKTYIQSWSVNR
jgi:type II secretory pathway pseudopilin PulG